MDRTYCLQVMDKDGIVEEDDLNLNYTNLFIVDDFVAFKDH